MAVLWVIPTCVALPAGPWDALAIGGHGNHGPFIDDLTYKDGDFPELGSSKALN